MAMRRPTFSPVTFSNRVAPRLLKLIRNRIDQFGVAEPDIRKQEGNRIQVQLPGLSDPRRAVQILGQTAHLEFHLVRDDVDPNKAVLPSGVMALPLLDMALAVYHSGHTFGALGIDAYTPQH